MLDLSAGWEAYWHEKRVYIQVDAAPFFDRVFRHLAQGLLGHPKAHAHMSFDGSVVVQKDVREAVLGRAILPDFEMVAVVRADGQQKTLIRASITQDGLVPECTLTIDDEQVQLRKVM